jgi:hypothetical protein
MIEYCQLPGKRNPVSNRTGINYTVTGTCNTVTGGSPSEWSQTREKEMNSFQTSVIH